MEDEIAAACQALETWQRQGSAIARTVSFSSFAEAIQFVNRVAALAEAADHHPDIDIRYTKVRLLLTTHDAGGLTIKDFGLARQIDQATSPQSKQ